MESRGSWKECDSEYYPLKEEEMKLYQNSKILGSHFYSPWIPIQKRKWIKQWVLGCNFSDKVLHFRHGLQSPVAKGSLKKIALGFAKFPWGPPESFDVEIFLVWSAHPVVLHYHISLQPLTGLELIIKILNSYYNALISQNSCHDNGTSINQDNHVVRQSDWGPVDLSLRVDSRLFLWVACGFVLTSPLSAPWSSKY